MCLQQIKSAGCIFCFYFYTCSVSVLNQYLAIKCAWSENNIKPAGSCLLYLTRDSGAFSYFCRNGSFCWQHLLLRGRFSLNIYAYFHAVMDLTGVQQHIYTHSQNLSSFWILKSVLIVIGLKHYFYEISLQ